MAYIYKITNKINGKAYIGKTEFSVERRWKEHLSESKKPRCSKRPLYRAINKYGSDNFTVEILEETKDAENREKYWIELYQTYSKGYNATKGGDGRKLIDYEEIVKLYKVIQNVTLTAAFSGYHPEQVSKILKSNEIKVKSATEMLLERCPKPVICIETGIKYDSISMAAKYIISIGKSTSNISGASRHIGQVCLGKRKRAFSYTWKFA